MAKILIIDDERGIRNTLKEILEFEKHDVSLAEDGAEGILKAEKGVFDIIFCDVKMPKKDGTEVLQELKAKGVNSTIIMISGHGTVETAVDCLKLGAFDFIEKPKI